MAQTSDSAIAHTPRDIREFVQFRRAKLAKAGTCVTVGFPMRPRLSWSTSPPGSLRLGLLLALPLGLVFLGGGGLACQGATFDDGETSEGGETQTPGDGDGDDPTTTTGDGDDPTFNCDPDLEGSCPEGQKCTVLDSGGPPVYDCVTDDTSLLPYDACSPAPGTGLDGCPTNHACFAPEGSPSGVCLPLCKSDSGCDAALCVAPAGSQIPFCAAICDPLGPLCPEQQDCQRVRKANFVCQFPLDDDDGTTADGCNGALDNGCAEGFVCETGGIIPGCTEPNCCTALCDLGEASPCAAPMICGDLPLDPQPGLESLGACYVPQ